MFEIHNFCHNLPTWRVVSDEVFSDEVVSDLKTIEATSNCFIYLFNKKNYTFFDVILFFGW